LVTHNPETIQSEAVDMRVLVADGGVTIERVQRRQARHLYGKLVVKEEAAKEAEEPDTERADVAAGSGVLIEDEERQAGRVSNGVFQQCFQAFGGSKTAVVFFLVLILWQSFQVSSDVWLSQWTGSRDQSTAVDSVEYNLTVYALLGLGTSLLVLMRSTLGAFYGVRAAGYLFDKLTQSLLHAPLRFFDANPIGRIINRYSEDISTVDVQLQYSFFGIFITVAINGFRLVTAMFVIKYTSIFVLPLGWMYVRLGQYYLALSREITRLLKVANSPVLSHVTMCEEGVTVLRGFGAPFVKRAIEQNFKLIDINNRAWYADALVNQWFAIRTQLLGCMFVALVVSSLVWLKDVLSPGLVGLAFMYAVGVDVELENMVGVWSELEITMVSPERIMEYIGIAPEGQDKIVTFDA
ncbi:Atp-binding protein, partial [Globisporangium polare]